MDDRQLSDALDAHDGLIRAALRGEIGLDAFLAGYADFYDAYALDGHEASAEELGVLRRHRARVDFHRRVRDALSGLASEADASTAAYLAANRFGPQIALSRLRALAEQYPTFSSAGGDVT